MGELGVSSLFGVYTMTWREFQLRLMSYKRQQKEKHQIARQMTYYSGYALQVQKPKPIEQFWSIDDEKKEVSEQTKEKMRKAMEREWSKIKN